MKRKIMGTHYTLETRLLIEEYLNEGKTVTEIAKLLHRDRGNLSREIMKHRQLTIPSTFGEVRNCNCCLKRKECHVGNSHRTCDRFELEVCDKLKSSPHVCNGCTTRSGCRKAKQYYTAKEANTQYEQTLREARSNMYYTDLELEILNNDFYNLVKQSGSIYHSLRVINVGEFNFKRSSIYRQIKGGLLRLKPTDLPRASTRKRKAKSVDRTYKRDIESHTFEDYIEYKGNYPNAIEWEMDCVQGIIGKDEQVFLTLQIVKIKFLFVFVINRQTAKCVTDKLKEFKEALTPELFDKILNILLTDNGHEFLKLDDMMNVCTITSIFYCHPYSSYEKGSIENNHEPLRRCIPQGVSLSIYNQDEINLLTSNINSMYREELDGACPFDFVEQYIPLETLAKIGLKKVDPKDVTLVPKLLGKKNIDNIKKCLPEDEIKRDNIPLE